MILKPLKALTLILLAALASCSDGKVRLESTRFDSRQDLDIIVYGATPAGITTAVAAARHGRSVLIIEPSKRIGGIISGGLAASDVCKSQLIGGLSLEFFERIGARYGKSVQWNLEPHVAEEEFTRLLNQEKIPVILDARVSSISKENQKIKTISTDRGYKYKAKMFVDSSYEGDLLAAAGVEYSIGRESVHEYKESLAGRAKISGTNQWSPDINPYDEHGRALPGVSDNGLIIAGESDDQIMAYNYRPCLSKDPKNQIEFPRPNGYNPLEYELLARYVEAKGNTVNLRDLLMFLPTVRGKVDINSKGPMSTDYLNNSKNWVEASHSERRKIALKHRGYTLGLLYFLANNKRVPEHIRERMAQWGLCKDEFTKTRNFPHQLYVRVGRRMKGEYILNQNDLILNQKKKDSIAWASCRIEVHHGQRIISADGKLINEGNVGLRNPPYQVPYRIITPKKSQATNLLVPVAASASHIAYSSLRMEPVFMMMGHAAGLAAHLAIDTNSAVQDVSIKRLQDLLRSERQKI